jgi:hypothetical protein
VSRILKSGCDTITKVPEIIGYGINRIIYGSIMKSDVITITGGIRVIEIGNQQGLNGNGFIDTRGAGDQRVGLLEGKGTGSYGSPGN